VYNTVTFSNDHIYHIPDYLVGTLQLMPLFPSCTGKHGSWVFARISGISPSAPYLNPSTNGADVCNFFFRRNALEHEYIGQYVFGSTSRKFTTMEIQNCVPETAWDGRSKLIWESEWGRDLLSQQATLRPELEENLVDSRSSIVKRVKDLFMKPDVEGAMVGFYYQVSYFFHFTS
jgi:hypothetical protein